MTKTLINQVLIKPLNVVSVYCRHPGRVHAEASGGAREGDRAGRGVRVPAAAQTLPRPRILPEEEPERPGDVSTTSDCTRV